MTEVFCKKCNFRITKYFPICGDFCLKEKIAIKSSPKDALEEGFSEFHYISIYKKNKNNDCKDFEKKHFGKWTFVRMIRRDYIRGDGAF